MEAIIETGKDGGYIITIGEDLYVRQTLWEAEQVANATRAAAAKAKREADKAAAEAEAEAREIEKIDALEKAAAAWRAKYPNKRRSDTKPTEDPGEGWKWTLDPGICRCIWTRVEIGR